MKTGDKLRTIEKIIHHNKPTVIQGRIIQIDREPFKVTIEKIGKFGDKFKESLNIADFVSKRKRIQILEDERWIDIKLELRGGKYVLCKIVRTDNTSSSNNSTRQIEDNSRKEN